MKVTSSPQEEEENPSSSRPRVVAFDNDGKQQNGDKDVTNGIVMDSTNEKSGGTSTSSSNNGSGNDHAPNQTSSQSRASSPPPPGLDPAGSPSVSNSYRMKREKLGLSPPSTPKQQLDSQDSSSPPPPPPPPLPPQSGLEVTTPSSTVILKTLDGNSNPPLSPRHRENSVLFSPSLRKNLMREQKERDPLFFYEVTQTLGVGSMGSVAKVKKRRTTVGGSARKKLQIAVKKQKQKRRCLQIPFVGGLFRLCIDDKLSYDDLQAEDTDEEDPNNLQQFVAPSIPDFRPFGKPLSQQAAGGRTSSILQTAVVQKTTAGLSVPENEKGGGGGGSNSSKGNRNYQIGLDLDKTSSSVLRSRSESIGSSDSRRSIGSSEDSFSKNGSSRHRTQSVSDIEYAMKSIHLSRVTDDTFVQELKNEIAILRDLDHPNIVRPMETFFYRNQIFIVMELCSGGDLYSRDPYTEEEAARIVNQILSAISYMHSRNIAHRDLKYENILFVNDSPKSPVKLIDFGLSQTYGDNSQLTEGVGTIYTMAPEVLKGKYTQKADIWSLGVITYMLLSSQMPFYGRKRRHIVEQILNCQYDFRGRRWKRISKQAKNFIEELLVLDPDDRQDADIALSCTWLNKRFAATMRSPDDEEETLARHAMLRYAGYTKLKKMALMVVAHKSTYDEIGILRKVFQRYDSFRDGCISFTEFSLALKESGLSEEDLRTMFEAVDLNGSGRIKYTEFLAATIEAQGAISEERLAEAFDRLDSDDSGFISAENLAEILGEDFPREEIEEMLQEAGTSKGRVSYSEFLKLWEQRHEEERHEALKMLGAPTGASSESMMLSSRSNLSLSDDTSHVSSEDREAAEARASFLLDKHIHSNATQVAFNDTIIAIDADDKKVQQVLDDEPIDTTFH